MAMLFSLALWLGAALLAIPGGAQAGTPATHYSVGDTVNFEFRTDTRFTNTGAGALTLTLSNGTAVSGSPYAMTETWDGGSSEWSYTYAWNTGGEASDTYMVQIADSDSDPTAGSSVILGNPPDQMDFFLDAAYSVPTDIFKQGSTVYVQVRLGSPETAIAASNLESWGGGSVATGSTIDGTGTVFRYHFDIDFDSAGLALGDWGQIFWRGTDTGTRLQRAILNINGLLHNGITTGSDKWNSDWGVTGTSKYGQFTCETCHERAAANIKRVKTSIATPDGSNWDSTGAPTLAVAFLSAEEGSSHFGDDAAGGRTTSVRVCEACHSVTDYHRYDITGQGGGTDHNNRTDCTSCHQHKRGFGASCASCHGNPPPALVATKPTNAASAGAHVFHATDRNYACSICHYSSVGQSATHDSDGTVTLGFVDLLGPGTYTGGSYDGGLTVSYDSSDGGTSFSNGDTNECSNIYCHGSTMAPNGGTDLTPKWDDATTADCGACHGGDAANPPTKGSHAVHAGSTGRALPCADCHNGLVPAGIPSGMDTHVDNAADFAFDSGRGYIGSATYSGSAAMLDAYGSCDNLYCHSNAQAAGGNATADAYASPTWGGGALACDACHGQDAEETDGQPASGSHDKHAGSQAGEMNFICDACHSGAGDGTTAHVDKVLNVDIDNSYGGAAAYSQGNHTPGSFGYGNCNNLYCHSNVQASGGSAGASAYATPTWGGGAVACDSCHGQEPDETDGQPASGSHSAHAGSQAGELNLACAVCHFGSGSGSAAHLDATLNVDIDNSFGAGAYSQGDHAPGSGGYGNCANMNCHGALSDAWGTSLASFDDCTKCHGEKVASPTDAQKAPGGSGVDTNGDSLPGDGEVGAHQAHLSSASNYSSDIACSDCHAVPGSIDPSGADGHLDGGGGDMTWSALATNSGGLSPTYGGAACSNTYCHGNQMPSGSTIGTGLSPSWADTAYLAGAFDTDCGRCHGFPPTNTATHSAMTPGDGSGCDGCHPHLNDGVDAGESGWAGGAFNIPSDHINGSVEAVSDCAGCHTAYPPTSGAHVKHYNHITTNRGIADGAKLGAGGNTDADWNEADYPVCAVCHDMSNRAVNHTGATDYLMGAPKASWQYGSGNPTYAPVGQTCSNVKCHFITSPDWQL